MISLTKITLLLIATFCSLHQSWSQSFPEYHMQQLSVVEMFWGQPEGQSHEWLD